MLRALRRPADDEVETIAAAPEIMIVNPPLREDMRRLAIERPLATGDGAGSDDDDPDECDDDRDDASPDAAVATTAPGEAAKAPGETATTAATATVPCRGAPRPARRWITCICRLSREKVRRGGGDINSGQRWVVVVM